MTAVVGVAAGSDARARVRSAVGAVTLLPGGRRFRWLDGRPEPVAGRGPDGRRGALAGLANRLYASFYATGGVVPATARRPSPPGPRRALRAALRAATGHGHVWEAGWEVVGVDGGRLVLRRDGLEVRADFDQVRVPGRPVEAVAVDPDLSRADGVPAELRLPRARPNLSAGHWIVHGSVPFPSAPAPFARLYLDLDPTATIAILSALGARLDAAGVPHVVKALDDPAAFARRDPLVVYLRRTDLDAACPAVAGALAAAAGRTRGGTPAFTLELAAGVGYADDPPDGRSFGRSRCDLLARGLAAEPTADDDTRLAAVAAAFDAAGIDLDAPHLEPGASEPGRAAFDAWSE